MPSNWHVFAVLVDPLRRDWVIRALKAEGITAAFHYVPLHSAPYARRSMDIDPVQLPVTDRVAASLIRLPISAAFTDAECDDVVTACSACLHVWQVNHDAAQPTTKQRVDYGLRVLRKASGVLAARCAPVRESRAASPAANVMFSSALPLALARERSMLERFDLYLYDVMNSSRLKDRSCSSTGRYSVRSRAGPGCACSMSGPDGARFQTG